MLDRDAVRRVLIVASHRKPTGQAVARKLAEILRAQGRTVIEDFDSDLDLAAVEADLAISCGGDGTILTTARRMRSRPIPTIGINAGKLGFLAEFSDRQVVDWFDGRLDLPLGLVTRMYLKCTVRSGDKEEVRYGLNDASIQQGLMTKLLNIDMWVGGRHAVQYRCDGLIVATPSGSTAYSLSAGGPILTPEIGAFVIAPLAPHTLTDRPVVVGGDQVLEFAIHTPVKSCGLVIDGHELISIGPTSRVRIERGETGFPLVSHGERSFFDLLRHKLRWGEKPIDESEPPTVA